MEIRYGEPVALLHEVLGNGCPDDESIFSLLARLESKVESGASSGLLQPVKQALARSRTDRGRTLTRYVE
jgi:hypothetical protein